MNYRTAFLLFSSALLDSKRTPIPSGERDIEGLRIGSWLIQRK